MNDQDDDKKNINQDSTEGNSENQPLVDETSQSESVKISSDDNLKDENQNVDQNNDQTNVFEASNLVTNICEEHEKIAHKENILVKNKIFSLY